VLGPEGEAEAPPRRTEAVQAARPGEALLHGIAAPKNGRWFAGRQERLLWPLGA
jgi:hypothetical protein